VSQKSSPFLFLRFICQVSSDFASFWQKHTPGNWKNHMYTPYSHLLLCVRTVDLPCKNCRCIRTHTATSAASRSSKPLNLYEFSIKMRTSASLGCWGWWSGMHQRVIGEAVDHVAWTAARLCENWWTRLQTLARIIWTLSDVTIWHLCRDVSGLPYDVKIVRFYRLQYKHMKRDVVGCAFVFVSTFLG